MKRLLILLFILPVSLSAQEKYFHELRGMEDSTGTTHLFYRIHSDNGSTDILRPFENNVYHLNASTALDSVLFTSNIRFTGNGYNYLTADYSFLRNQISKPLWMYNTDDVFGNDYSRTLAYNESFFDGGLIWGDKVRTGENDTLSFSIINLYEKSVFIVLNQDSLPSEQYDHRILIKELDLNIYDCHPSEYCFLNESDSLTLFDYSLLEIDQKNENQIFFERNDSLFASTNLGKSITFLNNQYNWSEFDKFIFSEDGNTVLASSKNRYVINRTAISSIEHILLKSENYGQDWYELLLDTSRIHISRFSESNPSKFYSGIGTRLFLLDQNSNSFNESGLILEMDYKITGLYKKPDSDILFVLTTDELFEVNTTTLEKTSLKKLPVSNEETEEVPSTITLHQNYPNPFNPTTTISFELDKPAEVTLTVFDALGRTVSILVNEQKSTGFHQVGFDASNLSSGIYFYQLEAGAFIETKQLTLIK